MNNWNGHWKCSCKMYIFYVHFKWTFIMNIKYVHLKCTFCMNIFYVHYKCSFFIIIYYVHYLMNIMNIVNVLFTPNVSNCPIFCFPFVHVLSDVTCGDAGRCFTKDPGDRRSRSQTQRTRKNKTGCGPSSFPKTLCSLRHCIN